MAENVYSLTLLCCSLGIAYLGLFVWRHHGQDPAARRFVVFCLVTAAWLFLFPLDAFTSELGPRVLLVQARSVFMVFFSPTALGMVLAFTGHTEWLKPNRYAFLLIIPAVSALLLLTSNYHPWFVTGFRLEDSGFRLRMRYEPQIGLKVLYLYAYCCLLACCVLLVRSLRGKPARFRKQAILLLVGLFIPTLTDILFTYYPEVWVWTHGAYLTPYSMMVFLLLSAWALFRHRLFDITPLARAAVMESMPDAVFVFDAQGRLADFNPAAHRLLGLAHDALGRPARQALAAWPDLATAIGHADELQFCLATPQLPARNFDGRLSPLHEQPGENCGHVLILRDVTAQKVAEERYRHLLECNPLGMVVVETATGVIVYVNQKAADLVEMPRERVIGSAAVNFYAEPADRERIATLMAAQGHVADFEVNLKTAAGRTVWCLVTTNPTVYDGRQCHVSSIIDISERKQAEDMLRAKAKTEAVERQQRAILDNLPVGVLLTTDPGHKVLYQNPRFVEMFGYTLEHIPDVAHWWPLAYPDPDYRQTLIEDWNRRMVRYGEGQTNFQPSEVSITARDGSVKYVGVHTRAMGGLYFTTFIDLTERRQAEQARRERDAAEEANLAKSRFLANISHEIRTPLNAILGFAQVLEGDLYLNDGQRDKLATIRRSGEHLLELITDMLDMTKIEAGMMNIQARPFDLNQLTEEVAAMFRQRAWERELDLTVEAAHRVSPVLGDEMRLRQILVNLLSNAVKFTPAGTVRLTVEHLGNEGFRFSVTDTGIGIAPEEMDLLFKPFSQTSSGRRLQEGTGLGLALSHQFVKLMGGKLEASSEPGRGSRFFFTLPIQPVEPDYPQLAADAPAAAGAEGRPPTRGIARCLEAPSGIAIPSREAIAARLAERPADWLGKLRSALNRGESTQVAKLIEALRDSEPGLHQALAKRAYDCDHEAILDLLDLMSKRNPAGQ